MEPNDSNLFDDGVLFRRLDHPPKLAQKETIRHFITDVQCDWDAAWLMAHHINAADVYDWVKIGPRYFDDREGVSATVLGPEDHFYAVFTSAEGSAGPVCITDRGSLRVFFQRVVNLFKNHKMCTFSFHRTAADAVRCSIVPTLDLGLKAPVIYEA